MVKENVFIRLEGKTVDGRPSEEMEKLMPGKPFLNGQYSPVGPEYTQAVGYRDTARPLQFHRTELKYPRAFLAKHANAISREWCDSVQRLLLTLSRQIESTDLWNKFHLSHRRHKTFSDQPRVAAQYEQIDLLFLVHGVTTSVAFVVALLNPLLTIPQSRRRFLQKAG